MLFFLNLQQFSVAIVSLFVFCHSCSYFFSYSQFLSDGILFILIVYSVQYSPVKNVGLLPDFVVIFCYTQICHTIKQILISKIAGNK